MIHEQLGDIIEHTKELKRDNLCCPRIGPRYIKNGDKYNKSCALEKQLQQQEQLHASEGNPQAIT